MANKEMFDFLSNGTADNDVTLSVSPQKVLIEESYLSQVLHEFDDGTVAVTEVSSTDYFKVKLQWDVISESDAGTIMDFWHNPAKGNGMAETFYWIHPKDGHTYVVRFLGNLKRTRVSGLPNHMKVDQITLLIEARKAE